MTLEDFFKQIYDFGTSMNLNADELYSQHESLLSQNQSNKRDFVKNGIVLDNKDYLIIFLAFFQQEENQIRYMNCEQQIRHCKIDEDGLELCKQSILDGIKFRKEEQNQFRLDNINDDFLSST